MADVVCEYANLPDGPKFTERQARHVRGAIAAVRGGERGAGLALRPTGPDGGDDVWMRRGRDGDDVLLEIVDGQDLLT